MPIGSIISFSGYRPTLGQLPQYEPQEDQTSREEGDRVSHGRKVRAALLVRVLHRVWGVQLPGKLDPLVTDEQVPWTYYYNFI